ncbi:hypothetical protein RND81_03G072300 [Saponaria officinalis]|uniref:Dof zinc finger protein n=1 Tax=Saponaria officinalis TaxID=3572 RepID=A0AAW1LYV0_SAPOF
MEMSSNRLYNGPTVLPSMTMDRRWRANIDPAPNCPRCASSNTKFCYYNNYSLSQPRFFCKGCKRYWTRGGFLRNVPVGGGCRKSRRSRSARVASSILTTLPNSSSDGSQESVPGIDMAAVFARFLNHDQGNVTSPSSDTSHDSLASTFCGVENGFDSEIFVDDIFGQESLTPGHIQFQENEATQEFINPDFASFDDLMSDVFGSDDSNISDFTWQQELDSQLLPKDEFNVTADLVSTDNWSYFDSTGFEI